MTHEAIAERADALLRRHGADIRDQVVVAGCSGGADSTLLLHVLRTLGATASVVHVNYGLRGDDSDADEALVVAMCRELGVALKVVRVDAKAGASLQDRARRIRYEAFAEHAKTVGARFVAVAHTLNDQSETVLLHLLRGTGIDGLAGMRVNRSLGEDTNIRLVRPLLTTTRQEVEAAAAAFGLEWRTDASNLDDSYARGRMRNFVVPAVEEAFGEQQWLNVGRAALHVAGYVDDGLSTDLAERFARAAEPGFRRLRVDRLLDESPSWRGRIILEAMRRWAPAAPASADLLERVENLVGLQVGKRLKTGDVTVIRDREHLSFVDEPSAPAAAPLALGGAANCGVHRIHLHELISSPTQLDPESADIAFVDPVALNAPMTVRVWRAGDRMAPLGMQGTRLISDLLTDRKVPSSRRATAPLVMSGDEIVWCAGVGIADRFKVHDEAESCLILVRTDIVPFGR